MNDSFKFNAILLSVIVLLAYFMFGEVLQSKFSIIDDHHIVAEVGSDNRFTLTDGINVIKNEKDFDLGEYGRFRPSFQVARTVEMYLFKNNVIYYQIARLLLFILLMYVLSKFIFSKTDMISGSIISLILVSEGAWSDIFTRIITSEIYTLYGLVVFIPVSILIYNFLKSGGESKLRMRTVVLIAYFVSGLISIGSKENFTFLVIVPAIMLFFLHRSTDRDIFKNLIGLLSVTLILYGLFIAFVIGWYFINTSEDISGYGFFDNSFLRIIFKFFKIIFIEWGGVLLLFPVALLWKFKENLIQKQQYSKLCKHMFRMFIYLFILSLFLLFQVVYYAGGLPSGTRYDFPMIIFYSTYLLILVFYAKKMLGIVLEKKYVKRLVLITLVMIFISKSAVPNIIRTSEMTRAHVSHTEHYYSTIEKIKLLSNTNPTQAVIVNSFNVWDFELIASFYKFLRANNVTNPLYLKLNYVISDYESSVERMFVERLVDISKGGGLKANPDWVPNNNVLQLGYESIDNLKVNNFECILINISKNDDSKMCKNNIIYVYNGR